jgi:hypothetical protein
MSDPIALFNQHRPRLYGIAYRMLVSKAKPPAMDQIGWMSCRRATALRPAPTRAKRPLAPVIAGTRLPSQDQCGIVEGCGVEQDDAEISYFVAVRVEDFLQPSACARNKQ